MVSAKVKKILQDTCASMDETIVDYIGGVLDEDQDISLEDFSGMASPFIMDSGVAKDEESAEALCKGDHFFRIIYNNNLKIK